MSFYLKTRKTVWNATLGKYDCRSRPRPVFLSLTPALDYARLHATAEKPALLIQYAVPFALVYPNGDFLLWKDAEAQGATP